MNIISLYTNITHADDVDACKDVWDSRPIKSPPTECQVKKLTLVVKINNCNFGGNHYLQVNGTDMGTKMASSYANIFMGKSEKNNSLNLENRFPGLDS